MSSSCEQSVPCFLTDDAPVRTVYSPQIPGNSVPPDIVQRQQRSKLQLIIVCPGRSLAQKAPSAGSAAPSSVHQSQVAVQLCSYTFPHLNWTCVSTTSQPQRPVPADSCARDHYPSTSHTLQRLLHNVRGWHTLNNATDCAQNQLTLV